MNKNENKYLNLLESISKEGSIKEDRTGTGTISVFGTQTKYDLRDGFPILTTKRVPFGLILSELIWFLNGDTNIEFLLQNNNHIWDEWCFEKWLKDWDFIQDTGDRQFYDLYKKHGLNYRFENEEFMEHYNEYLVLILGLVKDDRYGYYSQKFGNLGPIYGHQWRNIPKNDQIRDLIYGIKNNPDSRRHIVSSWNVENVDRMALPPCHTLFQCYVDGEYLDLQLYQRSADMFLGVPFNITSYSLLLTMLAKECGLKPRFFIHSTGDTHIYSNHCAQVSLQLFREPFEPIAEVEIDDDFNILEPEISKVRIKNYKSQAAIKAPVAI